MNGTGGVYLYGGSPMTRIPVSPKEGFFAS